jgi:hypothetical protein
MTSLGVVGVKQAIRYAGRRARGKGRGDALWCSKGVSRLRAVGSPV